jgi:hypothetical protein
VAARLGSKDAADPAAAFVQALAKATDLAVQQRPAAFFGDNPRS